MDKQKPSVGRIVHVKAENGAPLAAIITEVINDEDITVTVFSVDGTNFAKRNIKSTEWSFPPRV